MIVVGGTDSDGTSTDDAAVYDLDNSRWATASVAALPTAAAYAGAAADIDGAAAILAMARSPPPSNFRQEREWTDGWRGVLSAFLHSETALAVLGRRSHEHMVDEYIGETPPAEQWALISNT